jgi:hypothetical protein
VKQVVVKEAKRVDSDKEVNLVNTEKLHKNITLLNQFIVISNNDDSYFLFH